MRATTEVLLSGGLLISALAAFSQQGINVTEQVRKGNEALNGGRLAEAEAVFSGLTQEVPGLATAHQGMGIVLLRQGKLEAGRRSLLRVLELSPDLRNTRFLLGMANFGLGSLQQAEDDFQAELSRQPDHVQARLFLSRCLLARNRQDLAVEELRRAQDIAPKDPDVLYLLAENDGKDGRGFAQRLLATAPESYQAHQWLAEDYRRQGDLPKAAGEYRLSIERAPGAAGLYFGLGRVLTEMADYRGAMQALDSELQVHPYSGPAHLLLGSLCLADGAFERAIKHGEAARTLGHQPAEAHLLLGRAYSGLGNFARAAEELERAIALRPDSTAAHFRLAGVYSRLGKPDQAQRHLEVFRKLEASATLPPKVPGP